MQADLNNISKWCLENKLFLNPVKTELLVIQTKKQIMTSLYKINDTVIKSFPYHKHLGILIDNKLNFHLNTEKLITSCYRKWGILKFICKYCDANTFLLLYKTFILPKIEFSNVIFTLNDSNMIKIENVQRTITRYICYKMGQNGLNYINRLESLKLLPLCIRKDIKILRLINKIIVNENIPENWKNILVFKRTGRN